MMGLIGQGWKHCEVLEVTGTNWPNVTYKNCLTSPNWLGVCVHCAVFDTALLLLLWAWPLFGVVFIGCVGGYCGRGTPGPFSNPVAKPVNR